MKNKSIKPAIQRQSNSINLSKSQMKALIKVLELAENELYSLQEMCDSNEMKVDIKAAEAAIKIVDKICHEAHEKG